MYILIAPTHFRPSVYAAASAQAIARGFKDACPQHQLVLCPQVNGGAGTMETLVRAQKGRIRHESIYLRDGRHIAPRWAWLPDQTILFDVSEIIFPVDDAIQFHDSYGVGLMLKQLFRYHPKYLVVGLGDDIPWSDGGLGLLEAMGLRYIDEYGSEVPLGRRSLGHIAGVSCDNLEVPSPIVGLISSPQSWQQLGRIHHSGLWPEIDRVVKMVEQCMAIDLAGEWGTAAAGGIGFGLSVLGGHFEMGPEYVANRTGLEQKVLVSDLVVTGSELLGRDSLDGVVGHVAALGKRHQKRVIGLTPMIAEGHLQLYNRGLQTIYSILDRPRSGKEIQRAMASLLENASYRVARGYCH